MREILFRGQTRKRGEKVTIGGVPIPSNWVYGGVAYTKPNMYSSIIYQVEPEISKYPVYADTVGQFTGLKDKNGAKIFEGDIVRIDDDEDIYVVEYNDDDAIFEVIGQFNCICLNFDLNLSGTDVEIIGNIHDNSEMLEE